MAEPSTAEVRDDGAASARDHSPFAELDRDRWAALAPATPQPLDESELISLRGLGDKLDLREVAEVYQPLSRLLNLYAAGARRAARRDARLPRRPRPPHPFRDRRRRLGRGRQIDDRATAARAALALGRHPSRRARDDRRLPAADAELGAPRASCTARASPRATIAAPCCASSRASRPVRDEVRAPVYSHLSYDIVPDAEIIVRRPDILIVEGLNVLQPPEPGASLAVSDLFDFTIYVDARTSDIADWYERALPRAAARRLHRPAQLLPPLREPQPRGGACGRPVRSGATSTSRTWCRTSCRRAPAHPSFCGRNATTPSRRCC